jgi:hypothetical protein
MRLLPILATVSALGACASPHQLADADCASWGLQRGTAPYAQCMASRVAAIEAADLAAAAALAPRLTQCFAGAYSVSCTTW